MLGLTFVLIASAAVFPVNAGVIKKRMSTTCGILGFDKSPAYLHLVDEYSSNFPVCMATCNADPNCASFSVGYSDPQCNLYTLPLIENVNPMDIYNDFVFYDRGCSVELVPTYPTSGLPLPAQVCGLAAYDVDSRAYNVDTSGALANWNACNAHCLADPNCHSYAFGDSQCLLYIVGAATNTYAVPSSPFTFYDRACPSPTS